MDNKRIAKLVQVKCHFKCESCDDTKLGKMYEYKNISFVRGFTPHHYKQLCADCIYRTAYGTKHWKRMKKEGALDK